MHYILDGYNIIHKTPTFETLLDRSLEHARKGLLAVCKSVLQSRGDVAKITVVFDGKSDVFGGDAGGGNLEVLYSATGEDADDVIIHYLQRNLLTQPVVVSDDNYVCNNARALKVRSMNVASFLQLKSGAPKKQNGRTAAHQDPTGKRLSAQKSHDITKEYAEYLGLDKK